MKQKTIYILAIVCGMSFFSSAKQMGNTCDNTPCCTSKMKPVKSVLSKEIDRRGFDLSPLQVFVFGI